MSTRRERVVDGLRAVFGIEREERAKADSPSVAAQRQHVPSMFSVWGREDIGGLLTVSQSLMDRFADNEAMEEYPDINCVAEGSTVYLVEGSIVKPTKIEHLAMSGNESDILAYDVKKKKIVTTPAINTRMTGRDVAVLEIALANGRKLRVTPEHKLLTLERGYIDAEKVSAGDVLVASFGGIATSELSVMVDPRPGVVEVSADPCDGGTARVFDITTETHNFICEGAVIHNSAFHYFANDATQPNVKDGRSIWVTADDGALKGIGNDLLHEVLRSEDEVWSQSYTLGMYGNLYEELLITENGVVGINTLPVPTMRRVERLDGGLIGFVQDVTGQFTANGHELRRMLAGQTEIPKSLALFEDWQVAHFRLRGTRRRSPYGVSLAEGARWIWKRLVMLEDSVLIYKLCLRGDSQVWTPSGRKAIRDLKEGEEVYCYTDPGRGHALKRTKVTYKKHNGRDRIFRVHSAHRELFANATHPVLVETVTGRGKGKSRIKRLDYVEVQNLIPGVHRLVTPRRQSDDWEEIKLRKPLLHSKAKLVRADEVVRTLTYPQIAKDIGVHHYRARDFFGGAYELKTDTAVALLEANGCEDAEGLLEVGEHWGGSRGLPVKGVTVPEVVTEDFARWWGFMLGDGFITTRNQKKDHVSQNEVGFALGTDDTTNERYKALFEQWVPAVKLVNDSGHRLGAYSFVSSKFAEFMTLNGFIPGAHNKRLPEWIYRAAPAIKLAMIRGLADADAHIKPRRVSRGRKRVRHEVFRFEMCNRGLLEDVRELAMQLGITVTFVRERERPGGRTIKGSTKPLPQTTSYCVDVSLKPQSATEVIRGVDEVEADDIWDIGVEAEEHNFIANGVVVHNTRAPARYAYYIDVTDVPSDRVEGHLKKMKRDLKKKKMVDPRTGRLTMRYNPLARDEDFFIGVREGRELARVEVLAGPDYQAIDDVEYFKKMLHGTLGVPRDYLGQEGAIPSKSILSNDDVRAARRTMNLQRAMRLGYERIVRTHLAARGIKNPWQPKLQVEMTVPSGIWELAAYEMLNARADYAGRVMQWASTRYIQENILRFSEDEIAAIEKEQKADAGEEQAGELPSYAMPAGGAQPGQEPGQEEPGQEPAPEKPPEKPKTKAPEEWKRFDQARRLEERRYVESRRNHAEIMDRLGTLMENDRGFARREKLRRGFFEDLRRTALTQDRAGRTRALPSSRRRRAVSSN